MRNYNTKKQMSAAYRYSYSRLALNYYTFYETMCEDIKRPEIFLQYSSDFHEILNSFLHGQERLEQLDTLRNQVIHAMEVITAYADCFQIYEYVLNRMERRFQEHPTKVEDIHKIVPRVIDFLIQSEDTMVLNERIQQIIGELPIRFTRQKFYTMLLDGLSVYIGSEKRSLDDMMYTLRTESMIENPDNMEQGYEELYQILEQLKAADYRGMEKQQYLAYMDSITFVSERLLQDAGIYMLLQDMLNDLYVMILANPHAMIELQEKQTLEKIVTGVLNEFKSGNTSIVDDAITELLCELEGKQESAMERYLSYPLPNEGEEDPIRLIAQKVDRLLSGSPFVKVEEEYTSSELVDYRLLEEQTSHLCRDLDQLFTQLAKPVVRAIMAKLLASLPSAFQSADKFQDYMVKSLESCTDAAERETCIELLNEIMEMEDALV